MLYIPKAMNQFRTDVKGSLHSSLLIILEAVHMQEMKAKAVLTVQETWVLSLVWEDPMEKEIATLSTILIFPVVLYRCESWTIKKAECRRIDAFNRGARTLGSPLDSNEIN